MEGARMTQRPEVVGRIRHLEGTDKFIISIPDHCLFIRHEHAENMFWDNCKCTIWQEYLGKDHSVSFMFLHINGLYVVFNHNNMKYYIDYYWFKETILGTARYAEITKSTTCTNQGVSYAWKQGVTA
jgi:hypothetical protein